MLTTISTINSIREKANAFLQTHKFPSNSEESFRFTYLRKSFTEDVKPFTGRIGETPAEDLLAALPRYYKQAKGSSTIVFINGVYFKELSVFSDDSFEVNPNSAEQELAGTAIVEPNYFTEQNGANFQELFVLKINKAATQPINIFQIITTEECTFPRLLIVAKKSAEATINAIVSSRSSLKKAYANSVFEIFLEENAQLNFNVIEKGNANLVLMNTIETVCERDARFYLASFIKNSLFVRNNVHARLTGKNAYASLSGFYDVAKNELADNHILVDHQVPDCESNQFYKGLLNDESIGVFNGRVMVHKDAQRTNAYQSSKAVLLSNNATIHSMPQLEIFADDVKCSHGAAIGQLNKDELFYFKARGIDEETAKAILNFAYSVEVIEKINDEKLRNYLLAELQAASGIEM